jgi:hypothetical protein
MYSLYLFDFVSAQDGRVYKKESSYKGEHTCVCVCVCVFACL